MIIQYIDNMSKTKKRSYRKRQGETLVDMEIMAERMGMNKKGGKKRRRTLKKKKTKRNSRKYRKRINPMDIPE